MKVHTVNSQFPTSFYAFKVKFLHEKRRWETGEWVWGKQSVDEGMPQRKKASRFHISVGNGISVLVLEMRYSS